MAKCSAKLSYGGSELRQTPANQTRLPPTEAGGGKSYTPTLPLDRAIEQSQARKYFPVTQIFFPIKNKVNSVRFVFQKNNDHFKISLR